MKATLNATGSMTANACEREPCRARLPLAHRSGYEGFLNRAVTAQVAALMASTLGVDMVMTGHSLGRNKLEHLLASGTPPFHNPAHFQGHALSRRGCVQGC